jgi:aldose 1-epimerase
VTSWAITYAEADFGVTATGEPVKRWTIDDGEIAVDVLTLGGIIQSLQVPDAGGQRADVVLGFDDVVGYETSKTFAGALIGRLANRLSGARFSLDGVEYQVNPNEGGTALHGGAGGFHQQIWSVEPYSDDAGAGLRLHLVSPDGDQGFPGRLAVTVDYLLVPGRRRLKIRYSARTDRPTVVNLTQHAYFNLGGSVLSAPSLDGHRLQVNAAHYTPVNGRGLPSGEIAHVVGTPFDLRRPQSLDFLNVDHNLILDEPSSESSQADGEAESAGESGHGHGHGHGHRHGHADGVAADSEAGPTAHLAAILEHPGTGRRMEVLTTEPAVQVYSGAGLDGSEVGKSGVRYQRCAAVCLETQHYPDAPNQPDFPSTTLRPGEEFRSLTEWRFSTI